MDLRRVLLVSTPQMETQASSLAADLVGRCAGLFAGAVMHTSSTATEQALDRAMRLNANGVVAFGGGSTIGLGNAIALRTDLPLIAVATIYTGSEMTPILGETTTGGGSRRPRRRCCLNW